MPEADQNEVIGVIIVSHCGIAEEMLNAARLIAGLLEGWKAISTDPEQPVEEMMEQLRQTMKEVDRGKGVLIFTDLLGGTPANVSLALAGPKVKVICGMNLPMLIKVAHCQKDYELSEAAEIVKEYGRRHIFLAGESFTDPCDEQ
jgi:PTS system mannose-specific IIA component